MARTLVAASTHVASFATKQPRIAIGALGLSAVFLTELAVMMLTSHAIL